ncbi:hypothetical protein CRYUN_Cryun09bG0135800 [Craigia yunnanensis]
MASTLLPKYCRRNHFIDTQPKPNDFWSSKSILHGKETENDNSETQSMPPSAWNKLWSLKVPFKLIVFLWKICNNCLPMRIEIHKRFSEITPNCPMCYREGENMEHLFFLCPFTRAVWFGTDLTIRTDRLALSSIKEWIQEWLLKLELTQTDALWFYGQFIYTLWYIWNHRNKVVFQNQVPDPLSVIQQQKHQLRWISKVGQELLRKQSVSSTQSQPVNLTGKPSNS